MKAWWGLAKLSACPELPCPCPALAVHAAGKVLVRFYGEHSSSWVAAKQLLPWEEAELQHKSSALTLWGKKNNKCVALQSAAALLATHQLHGTRLWLSSVFNAHVTKQDSAVSWGLWPCRSDLHAKFQDVL